MKRLSLITAAAIAILSAGSAHAESLLTLSSNPGYVSNHFIFENTCTLSKSGTLTFTAVKMGVGSHSTTEVLKTFTKSVPATEMTEIKKGIDEARIQHTVGVAQYETYGGDASDFNFLAYAPETEAEENGTANPLSFSMHGDEKSVIKSSSSAQELLLTMTAYCEMDHEILEMLLRESPKRHR